MVEKTPSQRVGAGWRARIALGYLSKREYSRQELCRKLLLTPMREACKPSLAESDNTVGPGIDGCGEKESPAQQSAADVQAEVEALLDWLEMKGYLSDVRFVESRIRARATRQGMARIRQELASHGLTLDPTQVNELRETEYVRAQAVWERKFGALAPDFRARAAQARFLTARGFSADLVRRIVGGEDEF